MSFTKIQYIDNETIITADNLNNIQDAILNVTNLIYPLGSIYMSISSTSPAQFFGGAWEQLYDRMLIGAGNNYTVSTTGGTTTVTLTTNQIPAHTHTRGTMNITGSWRMVGDSNNAGVDALATGTGAFDPINGTGSGSSVEASSWTCALGFDFNAADSWTGATSSVGGSTAHNNMPPYLAVYMWKRVG